MVVLNETILSNLIVLGSRDTTEPDGSDNPFRTLEDCGRINTIHSSNWDATTKKLSTADLIRLIKGLTIAEKFFHWHGGSVAAAIWVFRELLRRNDIDAIRDTANWIFANRSNPYLPFGSTRYNSFEDYEYQNSPEYRSTENLRREQNEKIALEHREAAVQRRKTKLLMHLRRQELTKESSLKRAANLVEMERLGFAERWKRIATDDSVTLDYYPKDWANLSEPQLIEVRSQFASELIDRLNVKSQKEWRVLRRRLTESPGDQQ